MVIVISIDQQFIYSNFVALLLFSILQFHYSVFQMNKLHKSIDKFGSSKERYASYTSINANKQNISSHLQYSGNNHYLFDISNQDTSKPHLDRDVNKVQSILFDGSSIPSSSESNKRKVLLHFNPAQSNLKMDKLNKALNYSRFKNQGQIGYNGIEYSESRKESRKEAVRNKSMIIKHKSHHQRVQKKQSRIQIGGVSGTGYLELSYQAYRIWKDKADGGKKSRQKQLQIKWKKSAEDKKAASKVKCSNIKKTSLVNEQKVKRMFGKYHQLMKNGEDYLTASSIGNLNRLGIHWKWNENKQHFGKQKSSKIHAIEKIYQIENMIQSKPELSFYKPMKLEKIKVQAPIQAYLKKFPPFAGKDDIEKMDTDQFENERSISVGIKQINNKQVSWITIPEILQLLDMKKQGKLRSEQNIFFQSQDFLTKEIYALPLFIDDILFIKFLKFIWLFEKDILIRIVCRFGDFGFIVWLFVDGYFTPVYIDPLFPVYINHQILPEDCKDVNIYIMVISKAICKVKKSYQFQVISKISVYQAYKMVTGLHVKQLRGDLLKQVSTLQIKKWIENQQKDRKKYFCLEDCSFYFMSPFASRDGHNYYKQQQGSEINQKRSILLVDMKEKSIKEFYPHQKYKYNLFIIDSCVLWFFYSFCFPRQQISRILIVVHEEITFRFKACLASCEGSRKQEVTAYLYRVEKLEKDRKMLALVKVLRNCENSETVLRKGQYIIFFESAIDQLSKIFRQKPCNLQQNQDIKKIGQVGEQTQELKLNSSYYLSVITSSEVAITYFGQLNKGEDFVQDQENLYVQIRKKSSILSYQPL